MYSYLIEPFLHNPILLYALAAGLISSIASGIIGAYVVVKRITFISGSISHSVLAGLGLGLWLERAHNIHFLTPIQGALIAAILSALFIGWIHSNYKQREDSVIATLWSVGMAIGVLFISQTPGFNVELTNFLIGNILWVSSEDLRIIALLDVIILITIAGLHQRLLAVCFDEEQARLQGLKVNRLYLLLLSLIAITIVLLIQVVGVILVMTMLTLPSAIANLFTKRLSRMMIGGTLLSCLFCLSGTVIAYHLDWPIGATIALIAGAVYGCSLMLKAKNSYDGAFAR